MIPINKPVLPKFSEYVCYLKRIWSSQQLTNNGQFLRALEKRLARHLGVYDLILVANGTLALQLLLKVFKLKGEVVTTPLTFAATTNVLVWEGITPVFADVNPRTFNIDPIDVEKKITKKTSAILAVHLYGNPCDVEKLQKIARRHRIKLLYDAAHAFGVRYKNRSVLNYGDASILSFHATKIFNTIEGGAVIVKNKQTAKKIRLLRNFGLSGDNVLLSGINAKMNEFEAAMGLCNLKNIRRNIKARQQRYSFYKKLLSRIRGLSFQRIVASRYNYSYMPIFFENKGKRDRVYKELAKHQIFARKYFYYPLTSSFIRLKSKKDIPAARKVAGGILCLPLYHNLPLVEIKKISSLIKKII